MGGIWASIGSQAPSRVLDIIAHRGKHLTFQLDGATPRGPVCLRQVDRTPRTGSSPGSLPCSSGATWVVFDGCLYHTRRLRTQLRARVPNGKDLSDSELVLAAYAAWGKECLHHLDGMFSFVLWEADTGRLLAARDRFGFKPLYVHLDRHCIAFASEIKQLLLLPGAQPTLNSPSFLDFLVRGLTDHSSETLFRGIHRLPGGTLVELDLRHGLPTALPVFHQWYELPRAGTLDISEAEAAARIRSLLTEAVQVRWRRPGPTALCLSGGLDSATIAGILARDQSISMSSDGFPGLKASFNDPIHDEPDLLESVVAHTGATLHCIRTGAEDALQLVEPLVWHLDEPYGRASLAAQWMLFQRAADLGIQDTLDGQGADEQLAGYTSMVNAYRAYLAGEHTAERAGAYSSRSEWARFGTGGAARPYEWLAPAPRADAVDRFSAQNGAAPRSLGDLCRERMLSGDLPIMMRQNDRIGMAHAIETHVPFMDHRLVEFSIRLGDRYKVVGNYSKYLLRRAFSDLVPQPVLEHCGKGSYSSLETCWLRGPARQALAVEVTRTAGEWPELFDPETTSRLAHDASIQEKEPLMLLWRILCFGVWARRFRLSR